MRKFIRVTVIILLFFSCLFVGVYLAEFADSENPVSLNTPDLEKSNQMNILVYVVDQLTGSKPEFISAWSVILYYPNPSGIILVPLSSSSKIDFNEISRNFRLDSHNAPNSKTINYFEKTFDANWDAVLVMDLQSVQFFSSWISNNEYQINLKDLLNSQESAGNSTFPGIDFCTFVSKQTLPQWELLDSGALSEDHFYSQLSPDDLKSIMTKMMSEYPTKCEVIPLSGEN